MNRFLVRRTHALGDTILATAVTHRLRHDFPDAIIDIETQCKSAFVGQNWKNPDVNSVFAPGIAKEKHYDRVINLDGTIECDRDTNQTDVYIKAAFGDTKGPKPVVFPIMPNPPNVGVEVDWDRVITFHPNTSWPSRTIPTSLWQMAADMLMGAGYTIVVLGTHIDQTISGSKVIDTKNRLSLYEQAAAIEYSKAFLAGASGLLLLSGATTTPVVVFLTIGRFEVTVTWRKGILGHNVIPLIPDIDCFNCSSKYGNVTYVGCLRDDHKYMCTKLFNAETVTAAVLHATKLER